MEKTIDELKSQPENLADPLSRIAHGRFVAFEKLAELARQSHATTDDLSNAMYLEASAAQLDGLRAYLFLQVWARLKEVRADIDALMTVRGQHTADVDACRHRIVELEGALTAAEAERDELRVANLRYSEFDSCACCAYEWDTPSEIPDIRARNVVCEKCWNGHAVLKRADSADAERDRLRAAVTAFLEHIPIDTPFDMAGAAAWFEIKKLLDPTWQAKHDALKLAAGAAPTPAETK